MPGNLFEGNPVDEGTTQRGTDTLVHRPEKPAGSTYSSTSGLSPLKNSRGKWGFIPLHKTMPDSPVPTLQGLCDPNQTSASEVTRGTLRFLPPLEIRTSSIARNPVALRLHFCKHYRRNWNYRFVVARVAIRNVIFTGYNYSEEIE